MNIILLVILLGSIILNIVLLVTKNVGTNKNGTNKNGTCKHTEGFEQAHLILSKKMNNGEIVMQPEDFKTIVKSTNGNIDQALLCVANAVAYNKDRKAKYGPSPSAGHTVISGYPVGACVLGISGKVYLGANFEFFAPLSNTIHGEQCAIMNAAVNNEKEVRKLAVNAAPCGVCRQYLVEVGLPYNLDIIFCSNNGDFISQKLSDLIPESFGPINLGVKSDVFNNKVLDPKGGTLAYTDIKYNNNTYNTGNQFALNMCCQSYAPYSLKRVGVCLEFEKNDFVNGQSIENAAFNPTVTAIRGAFALAELKGKNFKNLSKVYLCEQSSDIKCPPSGEPKIHGNENPRLKNYPNCVGVLEEVNTLINSIGNIKPEIISLIYTPKK